MRAARLAVLGGTLALAALGCAGSYHVRTITAPEAGIAGLHAFRVLPVPPPRDGRDRAGAYDPMVNNSIANRALRERITQEFQGRGYVVDERTPDFAVAVYASARERLDVTLWDYGYPYWPRWGWGARVPYRERVTEYVEGTVVVDVVRAGTRELLWRGSGSTELTEDPGRDVAELQRVAEAIVKKFPQAVPRPVTAGR
jgi:hypothetical protein